jgi:hypothetical protein
MPPSSPFRMFSVVVVSSRRALWLLLMLACLPHSSLHAQGLLVLPDLRYGALPTVREGTASVDFDLVGSMDSIVSRQFWGQTGLLPGANIGLGSGSASVYTEMGAMTSGSWKIVLGSTLAVAEADSSTSSQDSTREDSGLNRFLAGGGAVSATGIRPVVRARLGDMTRAGLLFVPRAWINIPGLSSADDVQDYGGELGGALLFQRYANAGTAPFLTLEVRAAWVTGSSEFFQTIGREEKSGFMYLAPTLTLQVQDQINLTVSSFISDALDTSKGLRVGVSLLRKKSD